MIKFYLLSRRLNSKKKSTKCLFATCVMCKLVQFLIELHIKTNMINHYLKKLYCIVLYYIVFYCIVLYCIVLYCMVFYCITFSYIVLYYVVLHCIPLYCVLVNFIRLSSLILNCSIFYFFTSNRCLRKECQITKNLCV